MTENRNAGAGDMETSKILTKDRHFKHDEDKKCMLVKSESHRYHVSQFPLDTQSVSVFLTFLLVDNISADSLRFTRHSVDWWPLQVKTLDDVLFSTN